MKKKTTKRLFFMLAILLLIVVAAYLFWSQMINIMMPTDSRPGKIVFEEEEVTAEEYDSIAQDLLQHFDLEFNHIERFKEAGILAYEGPKTCLQCHKEISVTDVVSGEEKTVRLMENLTGSVHYRFFSLRHPNVYGFNGELADNFAMGKIDRPCPKPGSFAMTAWAELVVTERGETYSEGCGQCHIGGQYQAPLGEIMPFYRTLDREKQAIDCLICHAAAYDMNKKQVLVDTNGLKRWGQDRSMHAAAGISCIECHITEGHLIAKGTHTTTMMANDLPDVEVACEDCHSAEPHSSNEETAEYLNMHVEKVACQTCHIPSLQEDNATRRDFAHPEFEEGPGIFIYHDIEKKSQAGEGIVYVWWNGDGTFLGNAIGDNPNGEDLYNFYQPTHIWKEFADFDYEGWYEEVMRPIAKNGRPSKLYAMKLFNGRQHVDLQNIGPFGGMYVPYNLPTYYTTGDSDKAAQKEMEKSMMKMMYGWMFKFYLMDKFMSFMDVDRWNTKAYKDVLELKNVEPRWIPVDAMMEISHAIRLKGALTCSNCHDPDGVLDWKALGYSDDDIESLTQDPLK